MHTVEGSKCNEADSEPAEHNAVREGSDSEDSLEQQQQSE